MCSTYDARHTGCDPVDPTAFCGEAVLAYNSTAAGGGRRFAYDSGGRQVGWTQPVTAEYATAACARICSDWVECAGFVVISSGTSAPPRCVAVNDTKATVGTVLVAESFVFKRNGSCQLDCGTADGLGYVFSATAARTLAPASRGGVTECALLCDRLPGCTGFGIEEAGDTCFPVNDTTTTRRLSSRVLSYARTERPVPRAAALSWWLAPPTRRVFERDDQWMGAYCRATRAVRWEAAPGGAAAAQLAIRASGRGAALNFSFGGLVGVGSNSTIGAAHLRARQVGLVRARQGADYRSELGDTWYADVLAPLHGALQLRPNATRAVWLSLDVPRGAAAGEYAGTVHARDAATGVTAFVVPLNLTVWPIDADCLEAAQRDFGKAWGFDRSVLNELYPNSSSISRGGGEVGGVGGAGRGGGVAATATVEAEAEAMLCDAHVPPEAIAGQQAWANSRPVSELRRLLAPPCSQPLVSGAYLGGFTTSPAPANFTPAFADSVLDRAAPRVAELEAVGLLNRSYLYAFDESHEEYRGAVALLFGRLKARWPEARTLAVLNWVVTPELPVDIWVVQYELLDTPAFAAAQAAMRAAGRQVWGYHCVSPASATQLNTFVDVPLIKPRLLPWLSAARGLDGWLYWYTNWGARHAPSANASGRLRPLGRLDAGGRSEYDPAVGTAAGLADGRFTNEDGNLVYMGADGPLASSRLEVLRLGLEDQALLALLGREAAATLAREVASSATNWTLSADALEAARRRAAAAIVGARKCVPK